MYFRASHEISKWCLSERVFVQKHSNGARLMCNRFVESLVQELEWLNQGLHELYKRTQSCHGCLGSAIENPKSERISTHCILQHLGVLKQNVQTFSTILVEDSSLTQDWETSGAKLSPEDISSSSTTDMEGFSYFDDWASKSPHFSAGPVSTLMSPEEESIPLSFQNSTRVPSDSHPQPMLTHSNMEHTLHDDCQRMNLASAYLENVEINRTFDDLFKDFDFSSTQSGARCRLNSECIGSIVTSIAGPASS